MATIACSHCGKEIAYTPCLNIETVVGYGSKYDGDKITYHLCPDCTDKLIDSYLATTKDAIPAIKPEE